MFVHAHFKTIFFFFNKRGNMDFGEFINSINGLGLLMVLSMILLFVSIFAVLIIGEKITRRRPKFETEVRGLYLGMFYGALFGGLIAFLLVIFNYLQTFKILYKVTEL